MNSSNIITSVLHLKEASDLLVDIEPEVSYALLETASAILNQHKISEDEMNEAKQLAAEITDNKELQEVYE